MNNTKSVLKDLFELIDNYFSNSDFNEGDVVKYFNPVDLRKQINLQISEKGEGQVALINYAKQYLELAVNTGNKQFLNQLFSGFNIPAFIGDVVSIASNTTMATFEVAPVATEMERELVRLMNSYTGYNQGDGIFLTGGSNANLVAMFSARNRMFPESMSKGVRVNYNLKAFVNEHAHYSFDTAANLLGIGTQNVVKVKADHNGRMITQDLVRAVEECIANGDKPFFVAATCGTTVRGAFDPIDELLPVCKKHNLWLHVDGAFGGSLILSPKYKGLFKGLENSDSFTWDAHKVMNVPLMCSVILVKQKGTLQHNIIDTNTDYIYHDIDGVEDLGKKSVQCGRRADAVKLWFSWKYFGKDGYAKRTENLVEMAAYAEDIVKSNPKLELLLPRQSLAICFRYMPDIVVNLNDFNLKVRQTLRKSGKSIVNFSHLGKDLAIRLVITNGETEKKDVDQFFQNFLDEAIKLEAELKG